MTPYITVEAFKQNFLIDHSYDDAVIQMITAAASLMVRNYLTSSSHSVAVDDSNPDEVVQIATMILAGQFYRDREMLESDWTPGFLPPVIRSILTPYRDPVLR